jgi:hypothetical protein
MKRHNTPDGMNSKQRSRKRRDEAAALLIAKLRSKSASCANCKHRTSRPTDAPGKLICDVKSDFAGYVIVQPTDLCTDWSTRS